MRPTLSIYPIRHKMHLITAKGQSLYKGKYDHVIITPEYVVATDTACLVRVPTKEVFPAATLEERKLLNGYVQREGWREMCKGGLNGLKFDPEKSMFELTYKTGGKLFVEMTQVEGFPDWKKLFDDFKPRGLTDELPMAIDVNRLNNITKALGMEMPRLGIYYGNGPTKPIHVLPYHDHDGSGDAIIMPIVA